MGRASTDDVLCLPPTKMRPPVERSSAMIRTLVPSLAAVTLTATIAYGQAPKNAQRLPKMKAAATEPAPTVAPLAAGTAFNATLMDTLDSQKSRAGDTVTVEVAQDVRYGRSLIFPKGTRLTGHVTETSSQAKGADVSALAIEFDKALLKNGKEAQLNAGVQAIATKDVQPAQPTGDAIAGATEARMDFSGDDGADSFQVRTADYGGGGLSQQLLRLAKRTQIPRGALAKDGSMTPDCRGVFGMPGVNLFTSTKPGAEGTLLLKAQGDVVLSKGTGLLVVVQPPTADRQP